MTAPLSAAKIRNAKLGSTLRDRDLADTLGISEAQLVAAFVGQPGAHSVTRIQHLPDDVMPQMLALGEVMALTRNTSCVHERVGTFEKYTSGPHASMVLGPDIDTRIFSKHWAFGFAVETHTDSGVRKSLQFFDNSGDALQKIYMRDTSNHDAWAPLIETLRTNDESDVIEVAPRTPLEGARGDADKRETLLEEWAQMTDTHQFNRVTRSLGMNRLGAYRLASGEKWVRPVKPNSSADFLNAVAEARQKVILFVGNQGNIQIHWGTLDTIKPMGPWLNVLDPKFNLHLRDDHVAEAYVIEKPTKRGPAMSFEAFDADGNLIFQCFGQKGEDGDVTQWANILASLTTQEEELA
jgi:putative hemin transport protein